MLSESLPDAAFQIFFPQGSLYYDTLHEQGITIAVINPIVVKSLLRLEGKSDKGDATTLAGRAASFDLKTSNRPDSQQRELRLLFKRVDALKIQRTQITNRANGILTGYGFTVFRLVPISSPTGLRIIQAVIAGRSPTEIAALHRNRAKRLNIETLVNHSIVQTLTRSINTQIVVVDFLLLSVALFGAATLQKFAIYLLIGMLSGSYSSDFNAAPLLIVWENKEWKTWFRRNKSDKVEAAAS